MIKTADELKAQAEKLGLKRWTVHNCSMCGYPCGYLIAGDVVEYDPGCGCVSYTNIQPRSWDDLARTYNLNQPENNPRIKQSYLDKLNEVWKFSPTTNDYEERK